MSAKARLSSSRFQIRPATQDDVPAMVDIFFRAFTEPFWVYFMPDVPSMRAFFAESWEKGLQNSQDRVFVAVDSQDGGGKAVAFSRWQVPQADGNTDHHASWADVTPGDWDMELVEAFFGGMDRNRERLMEKRPHWFLDMLAVHEDYQCRGIAASLIKWGTDQADKEGVETMLHASQMGEPYYIKWHAFEAKDSILLPDKPAYGSYDYNTLIRQPQKAY